MRIQYNDHALMTRIELAHPPFSTVLVFADRIRPLLEAHGRCNVNSWDFDLRGTEATEFAGALITAVSEMDRLRALSLIRSGMGEARP